VLVIGAGGVAWKRTFSAGAAADSSGANALGGSATTVPGPAGALPATPTKRRDVSATAAVTHVDQSGTLASKTDERLPAKASGTIAPTPCDAAHPEKSGAIPRTSSRRFWLCFQSGQPEPRWWVQADTGWVEQYADGRTVAYHVVSQGAIPARAGASDFVSGTIVTPVNGQGALEYFLPDRNAGGPYGRYVRFRYNDPTKEGAEATGEWKFLAQVHELP
jgi:hypothetical protein